MCLLTKNVIKIRMIISVCLFKCVLYCYIIPQKGMTCLMVAAKKGETAIVDILVEAHADIDAQENVRFLEIVITSDTIIIDLVLCTLASFPACWRWGHILFPLRPEQSCVDMSCSGYRVTDSTAQSTRVLYCMSMILFHPSPLFISSHRRPA